MSIYGGPRLLLFRSKLLAWCYICSVICTAAFFIFLRCICIELERKQRISWIMTFLKCNKAVFMLLMTAFCLCSQCAHAISGRSSSQPFRGTSHKSSVSSRSSSLKCFHVKFDQKHTSQYYINHHYLLFFSTPGHLKPTTLLDSNHLRC